MNPRFQRVGNEFIWKSLFKITIRDGSFVTCMKDHPLVTERRSIIGSLSLSVAQLWEFPVLVSLTSCIFLEQGGEWTSVIYLGLVCIPGFPLNMLWWWYFVSSSCWMNTTCWGSFAPGVPFTAWFLVPCFMKLLSLLLVSLRVSSYTFFIPILTTIIWFFRRHQSFPWATQTQIIIGEWISSKPSHYHTNATWAIMNYRITLILQFIHRFRQCLSEIPSPYINFQSLVLCFKPMSTP